MQAPEKKDAVPDTFKYWVLLILVAHRAWTMFVCS